MKFDRHAKKKISKKKKKQNFSNRQNFSSSFCINKLSTLIAQFALSFAGLNAPVKKE